MEPRDETITKVGPEGIQPTKCQKYGEMEKPFPLPPQTKGGTMAIGKVTESPGTTCIGLRGIK